MIDGSLIVIAILIFIGVLTIKGIVAGATAGDRQVKPKPTYVPPPSKRPEVKREFGELRDILNVVIGPEHHRLVEIVCTHVDVIIQDYEGACKKNAETALTELEKWLREECDCPAPKPGKLP